MANVLIAPVGESPAAITSIYEALQKHPKGPCVKIDKVVLIYPYYDSGRFIDLGIELIENYLQGKCDVKAVCLPFEDINSKERSIEYLKIVNQEFFENKHNNVYVSIAGGRKNMAALITVVTQFYSCIRGVYHVIDNCENKSTERHFLTIEELSNKNDDERVESMKPVLEDMALIKIPCTALADSEEWIRCLGRIEKGEQADIPTEGEAAVFFSDVFGSTGGSKTLDVQLSSKAVKEFKDLGPDAQAQFLSHMRTLARKEYISKYGRAAYQGVKTDCIVFPKDKTKENLRIFFTWDKAADTISVHRIFNHDEYIKKLKESVMKSDYPPEVPISKLMVKEGTLMVTVGLSPMVVTQLFVLLSNERVKINRIAVIYPEENGDICNGVRLLYKLFQDKKIMREVVGEEKIDFQEYPVPIKDLDSQAACDSFAEELERAINQEKITYPHTPIYLSFTGGRKGMAAYVYYAAQHSGLTEVYHTVISDPELEEKIEKETSLEEMEKKGWDLRTKAEHLFLQRYSDNQDAFHLIPIPVIPVV